MRGKVDKVPPKDDSYRSVDLPPFLAALVSEQSTRTRGRCSCPGRTPECGGAGQYLFLTPNGGHHRRSTYARRIFQPAADGRYPSGTRQAGRRVLVDGSTLPGTPPPPWPDAVPGEPFHPPRGRGIRVHGEDTALCVWLPLLENLTPHGLRHGHKTWMAEDGIPEILQAERLGHTVPGIRGVYTHVSDAMRDDLKAKPQQRWEASLAERLRFGGASSVSILNELLGKAQKAAKKAPFRAVGDRAGRRGA